MYLFIAYLVSSTTLQVLWKQGPHLSCQCYIRRMQNKTWHTAGSQIFAKLNSLAMKPCPRLGPSD